MKARSILALLPVLFASLIFTGCTAPERKNDQHGSGGGKPTTHAHTPAKGSAERNAILAAVHKAMAPKKVVLVVPYLKVNQGWAWIQVDPQSPDGTQHYESQSGLLHKGTNAQWKLLEWMPAEEGTDQKKYFQGLRKKYPEAPADIFPE